MWIVRWRGRRKRDRVNDTDCDRGYQYWYWSDTVFLKLLVYRLASGETKPPSAAGNFLWQTKGVSINMEVIESH